MADADKKRVNYVTPHDIIKVHAKDGVEGLKSLSGRVTRGRIAEAVEVLRALDVEGNQEESISSLNAYAETLSKSGGGRTPSAARGESRIITCSKNDTLTLSSVPHYFGYSKGQQPKVTQSFEEDNGEPVVVIRRAAQ